MSLQSSPNFLRYVLWIDAISCLICGLSQVAFTGTLSEWLGLSATLLAGTGEFLLLYGVVVAFLATRSRTPGAIIWLLIVGNAAWAVACIACLLGSGGTITLLGKVYVIAQALTVAVVALLQYSGMRGHDARQGSQRSVNA
ncbi:MAG TPA: hypothetical protein VNX69_12990 [Steroidobacteraceae bacterium]|nr:hypothetical protein [Steroidobacteraceae bacterium]